MRFLRLARLKRRALELRDDGQLDAALAVHRRAFEVAASGPDPKPLGMLVDMTFSFLVRSEQQVRERLENVRSEL